MKEGGRRAPSGVEGQRGKEGVAEREYRRLRLRGWGFADGEIMSQKQPPKP